MLVGAAEEKKREELRNMRHSLQFADERHFIYWASFRTEWLQRFGIRSCNCVGFECANGGMVFSEVKQSSWCEEVPLAACTVCTSHRRSGPEPTNRRGSRAGRRPYSRLRRSPREFVLSGGRKFRGSQERALRQCQLQPHLFPPSHIFSLDFKTFFYWFLSS